MMVLFIVDFADNNTADSFKLKTTKKIKQVKPA